MSDPKHTSFEILLLISKENVFAIQQMILMKYQALFVTFEKVLKFEIVVCCK